MLKNRASVWIAAIALILSIVAFVLGSAPFTAAVVLTYLSIPLALLAFILGAWRIPVLAAYFGAMAWLTVPVAKSLSVYVSQMLILSAVFGCVLGVVLYANYFRSKQAT